MKNSETITNDTFKSRLKTFKSLLFGARLAQLSSVILIGFSCFLIYSAGENSLHAAFLLLGILSLIFFIDKFLSLKGIKKKSYTTDSLNSSLSKFKAYMDKRKKYEMYYITFWALTLIPALSLNIEFTIEALLGHLFFFAVVGVLGYLAYLGTDSKIREIEDKIS